IPLSEAIRLQRSSPMACEGSLKVSCGPLEGNSLHHRAGLGYTTAIWIAIIDSQGAREMNHLSSISVGLVLAVTLAFPIAVLADKDDGAPADVTVQFGQNQFPQSAPPLNHILDPNDVTINKGGTVTFEVNGGGHGIAIYPVSKNTDREDIGEDLCQPNAA